MAEPPASYTIETHTASDGYCWRYRRYPATPPRAHVVCIHGIQSHAGWYEYSCTQLSRAGFVVSFLDRRGSGMNDRDRGDTPSFRRLLDDLAEFLQGVRSQGEQGGGGTAGPGPSTQYSVLSTQYSEPAMASHPRSQALVFLVAISWGGKLAVALQRRHPGLVDGLALLCPGFFPKVRPSLRQRLGILGSRLVSPRKLFPIPLNDPELFTASPGRQQFIRDDPLGLRQATARFLVESVRLDYYLRSAPAYVTVPVLLLLAEHDRIIHNDKTRQFVEGFASADKPVIEYAGAHHTLEFEEQPDRFVNDLRDWLERHCGK